MSDLIWNLFQQGQLFDLTKKQSVQTSIDHDQNHRTTNVNADLQELQKRHEQLKLVTLAMWTMLKDHTGLSENDLKKYVEKIDLMDGKQDGRANTIEKTGCPGCKREILSTSMACPYCGAYLNPRNVFAAT